MNPCEYIWFNNEFIRWEDANTHVLTHALHYGSGVFEGIRAYETASGPAIFKAKEHYDRLLESCDSYDITCNYSVDTFIKSTCELIVKTTRQHAIFDPLFIPITVALVLFLRNPITLQPLPYGNGAATLVMTA